MESDWKWYHPKKTRIESEQILKHKKCGTFLVRRSESSPSDYVLSISTGNSLVHYRIKCSSSGLFLDAAEGVAQLHFRDCNELICYYKKPDCGLPFALTNYLPCDGSLEDSDEESDELASESGLDVISPFFKQQLDAIPNGRVDGILQKFLEDYVQKDVNLDWQQVQSGSTELPFLQQLLSNAASDLKKPLQNYLKRLEAIKELFAFGSDDYMENVKGNEDDLSESFNKKVDDEPNDLAAVLKMLNDCQTNIFKVEQKACKVLKETGSLLCSGDKSDESNVEVEYLPQVAKLPAAVHRQSSAEFHLFEVTSGALKSKSFLSLNVKNGKLFIMKSKQEDLETVISYTYEQILQLIKSKSYKTKLSVILEPQTTKNYTFESYKSRELFCQRVQQMKISHSKDLQSSELSVFVGTWNMGDSPPPDNLSEWYKCMGLGKTKAEAFSLISSDVYAIGTQESAFHEKECVSRIKLDLQNLFNREFKLVSSYSLWGIRLVIFIKGELAGLVNSVKQSCVRTGIANTLGNKGAVGISFNVGATSLCFINCHLTSGSEKKFRRTQNFHTILRGLDLGQSDCFDLTQSFHHLFWFGDLNYRIELEIADIIKCVSANDLENLAVSDQLNKEKMLGNAFFQFEEEELSFPPTYRYDRGSRSTYVWTKVKRTGIRTNVPSYCDRILWKSYPGLTSCNTTYGCTESIYTSDHSPVFATFDIGLLSQTMSNDRKESTDETKSTKIILYEAEAQIDAANASKFTLEFQSNCLESSCSSRPNSLETYKTRINSLYRLNSGDTNGKSHPWWIRDDLVELHPIICDPLYLKDQHLLIAVKGSVGQEAFGGCVIALKPLLSGSKQTLECSLTNFGVLSGILRMVVQIRMPEESIYSEFSKSKVYDLISVADEESLGEQRVNPFHVTSQSLTQVESVGKIAETMQMNQVAHEESQKNIPLPLDKHSLPQVEPVEKFVETAQGNQPSLDRSVCLDNECMYFDTVKGNQKQLQEINVSKASTAVSKSRVSSSSSLEHAAGTCKNGSPIPKQRKQKKEQIVEEFYQWLKSINHEVYYDLLVDNGYDDLDYFCSITDNDLKEVGIANAVHRKQIVEHAVVRSRMRSSLVMI